MSSPRSDRRPRWSVVDLRVRSPHCDSTSNSFGRDAVASGHGTWPTEVSGGVPPHADSAVRSSLGSSAGCPKPSQPRRHSSALLHDVSALQRLRISHLPGPCAGGARRRQRDERLSAAAGSSAGFSGTASQGGDRYLAVLHRRPPRRCAQCRQVQAPSTRAFVKEPRSRRVRHQLLLAIRLPCPGASSSLFSSSCSRCLIAITQAPRSRARSHLAPSRPPRCSWSSLTTVAVRQ